MGLQYIYTDNEEDTEDVLMLMLFQTMTNGDSNGLTFSAFHRCNYYEALM